MFLSIRSRTNPVADSWSAHPSVLCADIVSWAKVLRGFNVGCSCSHPSTLPPKGHFCFWIWQSLYLSLAPQKWGTEGFFLPVISPHSTFTGQGNFVEHHKKNMEFLSSLSVFVVLTASSPFLGQGLFGHEHGLGIAPQNSNQEPSPILVGKSQYRTGDLIYGLLEAGLTSSWRFILHPR